MSYATLANVRDEAGFSEFDNVTDAQVTLAISKADSEIDGVLASVGYPLPFDSTPPLVETMSQLLAAGFLLTRSYGSGAEGTNKDGQNLKKEARDTLKMILKGELQLVDSSGSVIENSLESSGVDTSSTDHYSREPSFTMNDVF